MGCQAAPESPGVDQVKTLESENQELRQQLESAQRGHVQAVALLTEVKRTLDEMTGREAEVRNRQAELESGTWENSTDLREQILADLETLDNDLKESRRKLRQAVEVAPELTNDEETSEDLKGRLAEKERIILVLQEKMKNLEEEAALREDLEKIRREGIESRERIRRSYEPTPKPREPMPIARERISTPRERIPIPRERISSLPEIGACYIFKGDPGEIENALSRRYILSHNRTYHVSKRASASGVPRIFRALDPEDSEISLGHNLGGWEILSVHKKYERTLFNVIEEGDETILRISDYAGFWNLGRFLIVEVR